MPIAGQASGSEFFRTVVTQVVQFIKRKARYSSATCDGVILKMHYMYTFWMCFGIFSAVWYSWYNKDSIVCASRFNADGQARVDHINLCLSYNSFEDPLTGEVKNIMFYKWLPISLLIIAGIYYFPRKISKKFENASTARLLEFAASNEGDFKENSEDRIINITVNHFEANQRLQDGLFYKYFLCNLIALAVNTSCIFTLDFFMQGRFLTYGAVNILTMYRDPVEFTDSISRTFPPFTICKLTPVMQLTSDRTEEYGCHLTHMELYEKIFFFLWWWLMFVMISTLCYIVFLTVICGCRSFRVFLLRFSKTDEARVQDIKVRSVLRKLLNKCTIGDVYLLYRIKQHTSSRMFWKIVTSLEPKMIEFEGATKDNDSALGL